MATDLEDRLEELFVNDANGRRVSSVGVPQRTPAWRGVLSFAAAAAVLAAVAIAAIAVLRGGPQAAAPGATSTPSSTPAPTASVAPTATVPAVTMGTVTGRIGGYGSDHLPASAIYALPVNDTADGRYVIQTERWAGSPPESEGGGRYTLSVPPGTYYIVAYAREAYAAGWAGGYTRYVTCGLQQSCVDHSLIPVSVTAGQTLSNIDLLDWRHSSWPGSPFPPQPR
jgi:hypothetical protein